MVFSGMRVLCFVAGVSAARDENWAKVQVHAKVDPATMTSQAADQQCTAGESYLAKYELAVPAQCYGQGCSAEDVCDGAGVPNWDAAQFTDGIWEGCYDDEWFLLRSLSTSGAKVYDCVIHSENHDFETEKNALYLKVDLAEESGNDVSGSESCDNSGYHYQVSVLDDSDTVVHTSGGAAEFGKFYKLDNKKWTASVHHLTVQLVSCQDCSDAQETSRVYPKIYKPKAAATMGDLGVSTAAIQSMTKSDLISAKTLADLGVTGSVDSGVFDPFSSFDSTPVLGNEVSNLADSTVLGDLDLDDVKAGAVCRSSSQWPVSLAKDNNHMEAMPWSS